MSDDADLIEKSELEILAVIDKMRKANVRYSVVHSIFIEILKTLELQSYAEGWLEEYNK